eukprot:TRINITY_DN29403_c0_g1_i1.p1 TRINITY_DN29403_c0_g1~~TRINITY_DN29403_c0_g1_i1.p1  ORF type:complete len:455 (-),score=60.67 TRINITY_DN29403_c0_g1_i1:48-1412(-)
MLLYTNRTFFRTVLTYRGSVFWRFDNVVYGCIIGAVSVGLAYMKDIQSEYAVYLPHHYGMHAVGVVVGFAVVFRTNLGWTRYWEAISQLHIMYSKWSDSYSQLFAFAGVAIQTAATLHTPEGDAKVVRLEAVLDKVMDNFILMSALAADRLLHGDTQRMEMRATLSPWRDQLVKREVLRMEDLTGAWALPEFVVDELAGNVNGKMWAPVLLDPGGTNGDATKSPENPKGDLAAVSPHSRVSRLVNFDEAGTLNDNSKDLKEAHVIRKSAMQRWQGAGNNWAKAKYPVKKAPTEQERAVLMYSTDRVSVVNYWIIHDFARISPDIGTPPPIQSRMYQELSNGMLAFNQAMKLADVPFPFPYAQLLTLCLVAYVAFIPVYMVAFTESYIVTPIMSFLLFLGIWGLNETAKELENPFGPDENDIYLLDFHLRFVDVCHEVCEAHKVKLINNTQIATL